MTVNSSGLYFIGDIHGHKLKLIHLLRGAGLLNERLRWSGGAATLCFLGDFVDRGPDGIGVIDLIMQLQSEAVATGGQVVAILGNHDPLLLSAYWFPEHPHSVGKTCKDVWLLNGGKENDLARLTAQHIQWLQHLPAMLLLHDKLITHADALLYYDYGATIATVNQAIGAILQTPDFDGLMLLLDRFTQRLAFADARLDGGLRAQQFLGTYGGNQLLHGHTPISKMTGKPAVFVTQPLIYADGLCVNLDAGMYMGSEGFVYEAKNQRS